MTPEQAVRGVPPVDAEELYGRGSRGERLPYRVYKRAMLTGRDLVDAQPGFDQRTNEPVVTFRFNANGARQFAQVTQENVGKPFAMVFDNEVISAPIIREPILGGMGQISGSFTVQSANDMALLLRSGELPGRLTVIEQRSP
jgi:preprotein translocase subunit SecD